MGTSGTGKCIFLYDQDTLIYSICPRDAERQGLAEISEKEVNQMGTYAHDVV